MKLTIDNTKIAEMLDCNVMGLNKTDVEFYLARGEGIIRDFVATGEDHFLDCFCKMFDETNVQIFKDSFWEILFIETSSDTSLAELADELCAFENLWRNENILVGLKCSDKPQFTALRLVTIH